MAERILASGLATKTQGKAGATHRKWHMLRRCVRPQAHRRTGTLAGPARASHNAKPAPHLAMSRGHDGSPRVRRRGTAHATCLEWMPPPDGQLRFKRASYSTWGQGFTASIGVRPTDDGKARP